MAIVPAPPAPIPPDNPAALAHITVLQGIINRLAGNSASCKTWCLTLVSALLGLAATAHLPVAVALTLIPLVVFGFLDAMYLAQETAYRALYARVVRNMREGTYTLGTIFDARAPSVWCYLWGALWSWSIWPVYLILIILVVLYLKLPAFRSLACILGLDGTCFTV